MRMARARQCRITRQRLGMLPVTPALPLPNGSYPSATFEVLLRDLEGRLRARRKLALKPNLGWIWICKTFRYLRCL